MLPKHFNEVGSRAKFSNNFRILGITGVPYEEINNWKSENKDIIQQSKLDWEFEYFDDFKTVDYSRLGTMVALATAKELMQREHCCLFEDFYIFPSKHFQTDGVVPVRCHWGLNSGAIIKSNGFWLSSDAEFTIAIRIRLAYANSCVIFGFEKLDYTLQLDDTKWHVLTIVNNKDQIGFSIDSHLVKKYKSELEMSLLTISQTIGSSYIDYISQKTLRAN